jgi:hypothetical protein
MIIIRKNNDCPVKYLTMPRCLVIDEEFGSKKMLV